MRKRSLGKKEGRRRKFFSMVIGEGEKKKTFQPATRGKRRRDH